MGRKGVEVIASFDMHGRPKPVRIRTTSESDENQIIKINRILKTDLDKTAGNMMLKYECETSFGGITVIFDLRYELATCRWFMYDSRAEKKTAPV